MWTKSIRNRKLRIKILEKSFSDFSHKSHKSATRKLRANHEQKQNSFDYGNFYRKRKSTFGNSANSKHCWSWTATQKNWSNKLCKENIFGQFLRIANIVIMFIYAKVMVFMAFIAYRKRNSSKSAISKTRVCYVIPTIYLLLRPNMKWIKTRIRLRKNYSYFIFKWSKQNKLNQSVVSPFLRLNWRKRYVIGHKSWINNWLIKRKKFVLQKTNDLICCLAVWLRQ